MNYFQITSMEVHISLQDNAFEISIHNPIKFSNNHASLKYGNGIITYAIEIKEPSNLKLSKVYLAPKEKCKINK